MDLAKQLYQTPKPKTDKPAETAETLARLYRTVEYGPDTFIEVFDALTAKFDKHEREKVLLLFNQLISK